MVNSTGQAHAVRILGVHHGAVRVDRSRRLSARSCRTCNHPGGKQREQGLASQFHGGTLALNTRHKNPKSRIKLEPDQRRCQVPRPPGAVAAERHRWIDLLRTRLGAAAHDVFTLAGGLGHATGQLYAILNNRPVPISQLARQLGSSPEDIGSRLDVLRAARLVRRTPTGWCLPRTDRRAAVATRLGVAGRLADRARRYALEREAWAWWAAELAWMHAPRRPPASRRPGLGQLAILDPDQITPTTAVPVRAAHPRRPDGRADFAAARRVLATETESVRWPGTNQCQREAA